MKPKPYYGLRLMSLIYQALAVIIAIVSIAAVGFLWADNYLSGGEVIAGAIRWEIRAIMTLGVGGLIALTCYVLSQLIDAQLETLQNTQLIQEQLKTLKHMQATQADILRLLKTRAISTMPTPVKDEDMPRIRYQLEERAQKLRSQQE